MADELEERLYRAVLANAEGSSLRECMIFAAREALRWRDETRPQQPAALAVPPKWFNARLQFPTADDADSNGDVLWLRSDVEMPCRWNHIPVDGTHWRRTERAQQPAALAVSLDDVYLAAQMLTWGTADGDGLDGVQMRQIEKHAKKLFAAVAAARQAQQPAAAVPPLLTPDEDALQAGLDAAKNAGAESVDIGVIADIFDSVQAAMLAAANKENANG